jgi:hypothetical protein
MQYDVDFVWCVIGTNATDAMETSKGDLQRKKVSSRKDTFLTTLIQCRIIK